MYKVICKVLWHLRLAILVLDPSRQGFKFRIFRMREKHRSPLERHRENKNILILVYILKIILFLASQNFPDF